MMFTPLNLWQKVLAYSSLLLVLLCTAFGVFAIWLMLTNQ